MALEVLQAVYRARDKAARSWKTHGGKVCGYLSENVPEELIAAAGFLPYRVSGDAETWSRALGNNKPLILEFVASMFDLIVAGRYDFLDYLVIPASRKQVLGFFPRLQAAKAADPSLRLPELAVLDRTTTNFLTASIFNCDRIIDFKKQLETWSGGAITDAALRSAIAVSNETRALIARLGRVRAEAKVSGVEALQIIGAMKMMPRDQANRLLGDFLKDAEKRSARTGLRVFVAGSPLDNVQLYELIETDGATVVSENHDWGAPSAEEPVDVQLAPLEAIADRYHKVPPAVVYPLSAAVAACVRRAGAVRAQAAVISAYRLDDIQLFEVPDVRKALDGAGIKSLYLQGQPYHLADGAPVRDEIGRFLASI